MSRERVKWSVVSGQWSAKSDQHRRKPWHWALLAAGLALVCCAATQSPAQPDLFSVPTRVTPQETIAAVGPLRVTVAEAVLLCLQHNRSFAVERYNPELTRTFEAEQSAVFDPRLSGSVTRQVQRQPAGGATGSGDLTTSATDLSVAVAERLPTGTSLDLGFTGRLAAAPSGESARLDLTVTQALLRGFGAAANLASLRQARLATLASAYELRGFAQSLVAQTEQAYWDYTLAQRQIEIVEQSLALAQTQLEETLERIRVGQLAEIERAAAEAEVALRRENEIDARSRLATARLTLLRLTNPPGGSPWSRDIETLDAPTLPEQGLDDVEDHVQLALRLRPELNQARLQLQRGDLEVVKTKNGLLPKLDAFVALGKTGYANSFGGALGELGGNGYDARVGVTGEFPWGNLAPRAAQRRAGLGRDQAEEAVGNLVQLAQVDVRSAHIEAQRLRQQVAATAATRRLQEEKLRAETEKFRVGRSTSLLVAQAQRDVLQSQIAEVAAVVNNRKAVVELHLQDGSLLTRLGIAAPGEQPVGVPGR